MKEPEYKIKTPTEEWYTARVKGRMLYLYKGTKLISHTWIETTKDQIVLKIPFKR